MNISLDNVNIDSDSGPNHFASKLKTQFEEMGHLTTGFDLSQTDIRLAFIEFSSLPADAPRVLRLDGIYFDPRKNYKNLNKHIEYSYNQADGIIFQSQFNRDMIFQYFGEHPKSTIINNGADIELINDIHPVSSPGLDKYENVWCCASNWRDWKRLKENIRYFLECASEKDCLIVAGDAPAGIEAETLQSLFRQHQSDIGKSSRVYFVGQISIKQLYSIYRRAKYFIHLARYDSCPNVVVDARAAGCQIICSSVAGTKEIAGMDAIVVHDEPWDYKPVSTAYLPDMSFDKIIKNTFDTNIDIIDVSKRYESFLKEIL